MRTRLARPDRVLRLLDIAELPPAGPADPVEIVTASVTDPDAMALACQDVDAIIHLGGVSREDAWDRILEVNVDGTHTLLEAARAAGVPRIVLASSNHSVGFRRNTEGGAEGVGADTTPHPDTYYGFSKAAIEALGALYHHRFGMDVICIRIGTCFEKPWDERGLGLWMSPDDCALLLEACLSAPEPGYRIINGTSANTRKVFSLREAEELGYRPEDDAEKFAPDILGDQREPTIVGDYLGGAFTTTALGAPNPI
jgi:NADP-dependent aldehyde dehydrogenase